MAQKKVIVAGCGIGGLDVVHHLYKDFDVTVINRDKWLYFYPAVQRVVAEEHEWHDVCIDLEKHFNKRRFHNRVSFVQDAVTNIDPEKQIVRTEHNTHTYDYLVIALGSQTNFFGANIDAVEDAIDYRDNIEEIRERLEHFARYNSRPHIAVVGGGPTGVEAIGSIATFCTDHNVDAELSLIEGGEQILGTLSKKTREKSQHLLEQRDINILTETMVEDVADGFLILHGGEKLEVDLIVWAAGVTPAPVIETLPLAKDDRGALLANRYLQSLDYENIFLVGDCMNFESGGKVQRAYYAIREATMAAQNIQRSDQNESLETYEQKEDAPFILSIGEKGVFTQGDNVWSGKIPVLMEHLGVHMKYLISRKHFF